MNLDWIFNLWLFDDVRHPISISSLETMTIAIIITK